MNILVVASTFPRRPYDSQPRFVLDFAVAVAARHQVTVLAPYEKGSRLHETIEGIEVFRFPYALPGTERLAYRGGMVNAFRQSLLAKLQLPCFLVMETAWLLWLARAKKSDIINAHWLFPQGLVAVVARRLSRRPTIVTTHGGDVAILRHKWHAKLLKPVMTGADAVTFVSGIARDNALQDLNLAADGRYAVMPMGVDLPVKVFRPRSRRLEVIFIGRLVKIKGIEVLLRAFRSISRRHGDLRLRILGDGPIRPELEREVAAHDLTGQVAFEGFVTGDQKHALLAGADIMVVPSIKDEHGYEEGLPVSALEALAYGKVLIASATGSLPALIDGSNGLLVPGGDADALAGALESVIKDQALRRRLAKAGQRTVLDYTWDAVAAKFDHVVKAARHA